MGIPVAREIADIRKLGLKKAVGLEKAIAWREGDHLHGESIEAGVIILPTRGCYWAHRGGCSMCGYVYDARDMGQEAVYENFAKALERVRGVKYLKLFNSGSFFDEREISRATREKILSLAGSAVERLQVESRPEFVTNSAMEHAREAFSGELEVGIGLETANDEIRRLCINKGFLLEDFSRALGVCKQNSAKLKAYLLVKPPFIPEKLAIDDAVSSALEAFRLGADRVSLNPLNVQRFTLVERLFHSNEYSPPWLWSVVEILGRVRQKVEKPIICKPSGAGKARGPSNCRVCSGRVARAIEEFSASQVPGNLEGLDCNCKEEWRLKLMYEEASN